MATLGRYTSLTKRAIILAENSRNVVLFRNRRLHSSPAHQSSKGYIETVTVLGGGHMGTGIAQVSATSGNFVTVVDVSQSALTKSREKIAKRLYRYSKKQYGKEEEQEAHQDVEKVLSRLIFTTDVEKSVRDADLVIEALPEDLQLKHQVLSKIDSVAPASSIFVTNTSSLRVQEVGECLSGDRRANLCGTHFFEAVIMKLVEVIKTPATKGEVFHRVHEWVQYLGKTPVTCQDTPAFIVNRLNIPLLIDAVNMYERGDATKEDIDMAMTLGAGFPQGLFRLADFIGIDTLYLILTGWEKRYSDVEYYKCPETIKKLYKEGKFGKKSGEGFYKYDMD